MNPRFFVGLFLILILCSCFPQISNEIQSQDSGLVFSESTSGLSIERSLTRGTGFRDSEGSDNIIVHITNTISNDTTIPILLAIALPVSYSYPIFNETQEFRIILWPGLSEPPYLYTGSTERSLANSIENETEFSNRFSKLLEPGESFLVTIGTIVPSPAKVCSVVAFSIVGCNDRAKHADCEWLKTEVDSSDPNLTLGLKVGFCTSGQQYESCVILPCGQMVYVEE